MQKSIISAMMAYVLWGILPIYWKALKEVSPLYILASRIFWSFLFCVIFVTIIKKWPEIKTILLDKKRFIYCILSGIMVSLNWYTYIWAVNANFIIDASLGYYINPLVVVLFSALFFGERFNKWESLSVLLALVGVVFITLKIGKFPVVAIVLALTFALYGVFKKKLNASPIVSLILETAVVAPFAFVTILYIESQGQGSLHWVIRWWQHWQCWRAWSLPSRYCCMPKGSRKYPFHCWALFNTLPPQLCCSSGYFFMVKLSQRWI